MRIYGEFDVVDTQVEDVIDDLLYPIDIQRVHDQPHIDVCLFGQSTDIVDDGVDVFIPSTVEVAKIIVIQGYGEHVYAQGLVKGIGGGAICGEAQFDAPALYEFAYSFEVFTLSGFPTSDLDMSQGCFLFVDEVQYSIFVNV